MGRHKSPMNIKNINSAKYLISIPLIAFFLWMHQVYVTRTHPDAVYMDSLRLVYQLQQWRQGHLSFLNFWGLGGEHQGFINQIFLMLNVRYFSYDVMLATRFTGFVIALVAMVILLNFNSGISEVNRRFLGASLAIRTSISALMVLICFSWANFELFTLDLGLPLWIKNFSFVTYFAVHAYYLAMPVGGRRHWAISLALTLAGPMIVLIVGMGWSYSFVAAVLAVNLLAVVDSVRRHDVRTSLSKLTPAIALLLAQAVYLMASIGVGGTSAPHNKFSMLLRIPGLLFYALGSGLIGVETIVNYPLLLRVLVYASGSAFAAAIVLVFVRCKHALYRGSLLPLYLLAYGFLVALSVSAARGAEGAMAVMASRYYMDIMFFYIGLIWLWYDGVERSLENKRYASIALFFSLCVVVVVGQGLTYKKEWVSAPYRALAIKSMNQALLQGVPDQQAASLLQQPLDNARKGRQVLLEQHLALYSDFPADTCMADNVHYLSGWYAREPQGVWTGRNAIIQIPACQCDFVASIYLPSNFSERTLAISDTQSSKSIGLTPGKVEKLHISPSNVQRTIDISVSRTTTPSNVPGGANDVRELGVLWTGNTFACGRGVLK